MIDTDDGDNDDTQRLSVIRIQMKNNDDSPNMSTSSSMFSSSWRTCSHSEQSSSSSKEEGEGRGGEGEWKVWRVCGAHREGEELEGEKENMINIMNFDIKEGGSKGR